MGIDTTPDVEESTEPPICAFTNSTLSSTAAAGRSSCEQREIDEKPPATLRASYSLRSGTCQYESQETSRDFEKDVKNAHLLEPSDLATLLQTDPQYVLINYYLEDPL